MINTITNFMILFGISTFVIIISIPDILIVASYAQPVGKEILLGPNPFKGGDDTYTLDSVTIDKDDTVMWINKDFGIHTITENQGSFSSKDLRPDQSFEYTFENVGTYGYHCKLHPEMMGKIIVN